MGYVNCNNCGERMLAKVGKNSIVKNGVFQHKKCPQKKLEGEDLAIYKKIKDAIVEAYIEYGSSEAKQRGLNWLFINNQVNKLVNDGFSYDDILYSFESCIKRDKVYWGFGRVNKFIEQDTLTRKKVLAYHEEVAQIEKPEKFKYEEDDFTW